RGVSGNASQHQRRALPNRAVVPEDVVVDVQVGAVVGVNEQRTARVIVPGVVEALLVGVLENAVLDVLRAGRCTAGTGGIPDAHAIPTGALICGGEHNGLGRGAAGIE